MFTKVGERPTADSRDIPADVAWYAHSCSQCGYCVDECDQFYGRGWESQIPRGKWYWLREYMKGNQEWGQKVVDTFLVCTTCERCNIRCSAALPIEPSWMKLRGKLIHEEKKMTFPPFEMMAEAALKEGNIWAGYRKNRSAWFPEDLKEKHGPGKKAKAAYFAGCTASYVEPDIGMASVRLLDAAGVDFTYVGNRENCCGTPMLVTGKWEVFEAMIALMTPQGFANLMSTMWPEMINAMPFGMGPMMRVMGKIPGALSLMKPMFPILFPRLLPMMMPKVMPTMLQRVADRVPMPDYMLEQMPVLMPKVMDSLMPT